MLQGVIGGKLNKQIAARLGTAEKTIKVHRGRVMHKMGVVSVAELVMDLQPAEVLEQSNASKEKGARGVPDEHSPARPDTP